MKAIIKQVIDKEFVANEIPIVARVDERAWQGKQVIDYQIKLYIKDSKQVLTAICHAQRPFNLKITDIIAMEPHRLIRLCDILQEAVKELERKSEEGEDQFR